VAAEFTTSNVAQERLDPTSIYNLYRRLIAVRRRSPSLLLGRYEPIEASGDLLLYVREHQAERTLIALNLGVNAMAVTLPDRLLRGTTLVSSGGDRDGAVVTGALTLRGHEGVVVALAPEAAQRTAADERKNQ
jgi:alpha-glucosidase